MGGLWRCCGGCGCGGGGGCGGGCGGGGGGGGGWWYLAGEYNIDILRVVCVVADEFFSCCVICVAYVDVSCVVSVTEYAIVFDGGIVARWV